MDHEASVGYNCPLSIAMQFPWEPRTLTNLFSFQVFLLLNSRPQMLYKLL